MIKYRYQNLANGSSALRIFFKSLSKNIFLELLELKYNVYNIFWRSLLLSVWNAVVNMEWKMILLLVGWVGKCSSELGTRRLV